VRPEHHEIAAASKTVPRKIVFAERSGKPIHLSTWEKADDTEEEPGMCTQRNRRGMGSSITGKIRRITSGESRWQQGLVTTCKDSLHEARSRRKGEPHGIGE
jgi:hypothetical protein